MSNLVFTIKGLIPRDLLEVKDVITETENSRSVATEWYYMGELVRRSCATEILAPPDIAGEQPKLA